MRNRNFVWIILVTILTAVPAAAQDSGRQDASVPDGVPADWFAGAQSYIRSSEYFPSWQTTPLVAGDEPCYQAPNRAQGLRFGFGADGLVVVPRAEPGPGWSAKVHTVGIGRDGEPAELATVRPEVEKNRVTLQRGSLVERFTNDEDGLHLELEISEPPAGHGKDLPARIALHIDGDLSLHRAGTATIELRREGEAALRIGPIAASDASGKRLPLELLFPPSRGSMDVLIGDEDAAYPITTTIDLKGIAAAHDWMAESNQTGAGFGFSVATAGDIDRDGYSEVIVGAYDFDNGGGNRGKVFVFDGHHTGLSTTPSWERGATNGWEEYGFVVGTAGDVNDDGFADVFAAAPKYDPGSASNTGRVYVYHGSLGGLPAAGHSWSAIGEYGGDRFGSSVSTAGDVDGNGYSDLVVGAPFWDFSDVVPDDGKIYVYYGGGGGLGGSPWTKTLMGELLFDEMNFGHSVSTAGDVNGNGCDDIIVGSPFENVSGISSTGRARVYFGSVAGMMNDPAKLLFDTVEYLHFGRSVATAGDVNGDGHSDVIVGMPGYVGSSGVSGGAAVYLGNASGIADSPHWYGEGHVSGGLFGGSVATAGDVNGDGYSDILVGDVTHLDYTGAMWLWTGSADGLGPVPGTSGNQAIFLQGPHPGAYYGDSVATAGDVNGDGYSDIIIGAPDASDGQANEGAAYVHYGGPDNLSETSSWYTSSVSIDSALGYAVATAGDVNGDGYADIVVGAPYYTYSYSNEGGVFVYYGSSQGPPNPWPDWQTRGDQAEAHLGWSVGTAGDVNGDGYADLIAGAPDLNNSLENEGGIYVWYGSSSGLAPSTTVSGAPWFAESNQSGARLGYSVGTAGDVNGDGYADVVAGAPEYSNPEVSEGLVAVWHGSATGLGPDGTPANADWKDETDADGRKLGWSVGTAGDVNGDGFSDLISGATDMAMVWNGSSSGLSPNISWWRISGAPGELVGFSVGTAGDVNGDGYADVVVGTPKHSLVGVTWDGRVEAFFGSSGGLSWGTNWVDYGVGDYAHLGYSVGTAGDLNGDGYADIVAGAPFFDNGDGFEGQVRVYYGGPSGPISVNQGDWSSTGALMNSYLGGAVGTAGDINGDAYADLLVGATGLGSDGMAILWAGNGGYGVPLRPRQMQPLGDPDPLSPLATTGDTLYLDVMVNAHCPTGWGTVKAYTEIKELGVPFDGWGGAWYSSSHSTQAGTPIHAISYELENNKVYHWRTRLINDAVTSPFAPPRGRWIHQPWNGWGEADFRTGSGGGSQEGLIFADGFESGSTSAW